MSFKIYKAEEVRYDIANYNESTDEQKNLIWLNEVKNPYNNIEKKFRIMMEHTSRLVKIYIETSDEEEKQALWDVYDDFTRMYCDRLKYRQIKRDNRKIR